MSPASDATANNDASSTADVVREDSATRFGFVVTPTPVYDGQYPAVGDPSVVVGQDGRYWMYHHCLDVQRQPQGGEVCLAVSNDGLQWSRPRTALGSSLVEGRVLAAQAGRWDEAHETPAALIVGGETRVYFIGYQGAGFFQHPETSFVGFARSSDGTSFDPIGDPTVRGAGPDAHGITSPSIVQLADGTFVLYSTAWRCSADVAQCVSGAPAATWTLSLVARTSADGLRFGDPTVVVAAGGGPSWTNGALSEASVTRGPDGRFYLLFSSIPGPRGSANEQQRIGIAVADQPTGPFRFAANPIVSPSDTTGAWARGGTLAPTAIIENGRMRVWFHGFETNASGAIVGARIGYAESSFPPAISQ